MFKDFNIILFTIITIVTCLHQSFLVQCHVSQNIDENVKFGSSNPDEYLDVPQVIARHGYPSETHSITTKDGYILAIHRIPGNKNRTSGVQPVFLQHGLLGSSYDWIVNPNSLAFLLADCGYDVWLGNSRGNTYSKAHIKFSTCSAEFWNFTWHEMGTQDIPSVINYISDVTQKSGDIIYVGHSMGTTQFFVFASLMPESASKIKMMIGLAPVAYMSHVRTPIRYLAPFSNHIEWLAKHLGANEFLPNNKLLQFLAYDCELLKIEKDVCANVIFVLAGFDEQQLTNDILRLIFTKYPAGTSTKTIVHYAQEINAGGRFQQFDYDSKLNLIKYNSTIPPAYNVSNIRIPIYLMYGKNDWLVGYPDVTKLSTELPKLIRLHVIPMDLFNHVDFLFGKDAKSLVYDPLLKVMKKFSDTM